MLRRHKNRRLPFLDAWDFCPRHIGDGPVDGMHERRRLLKAQNTVTRIRVVQDTWLHILVDGPDDIIIFLVLNNFQAPIINLGVHSASHEERKK